MQDEKTTSALYNFLSLNIDKIKDNSLNFSDGHPDFSWLYKKNIIHRGALNKDVVPHTKGAFEACIEHGYPMEVDLLRLRDGTIIIGRNDHDIGKYGFSGRLSDYNRRTLNQINAAAPKEERILCLDEFCDLISDQIPVLFEIKIDSNDTQDKIDSYVRSLVKILRLYFRRSVVRSRGNINRYVQKFAIHSSSPYAIRSVKMLDCMIPCGIISTDFSKTSGLTHEFVKIHDDAEYMNIAHPDFLCYDIQYMENGIARRECDKAGIPLLAWTIKSHDDEFDALSVYKCDGIIIGGASSYTN